MSHINTRPGEHDPTVSLFIVRKDHPELEILFHRHKLLNKYIQPGGHIHVNENPWQAACRELQEETGYDISQLKVFQPKERLMELPGAILHPVPLAPNTHEIHKGHFHDDNSYALLTDEDPRGQPRDGESKDLVWLTRAAMDALPSDQTIENVRVIARFVFDVCLKHFEIVPSDQFAVQ